MPTPERHPSALTVAGSDSGGGAGIQADLRTFALHGIHGASAVTGITAQNTQGVREIHPIPTAMVRAQCDAVFDDLHITAVKTGMLGEPALIATVAKALAEQAAFVLVDPVMVATSGDRLLPEASITALKEMLLPSADLITPNYPEAALLLDWPPSQVRDEPEAAARTLAQQTNAAVLLKGGHDARRADDILYRDGRTETFPGSRIDTPHTHGTGCHFAAAITARLVRGVALPAAIRGAKQWLAMALAQAHVIGRGTSPPWPPTARD